MFLSFLFHEKKKKKIGPVQGVNGLQLGTVAAQSASFGLQNRLVAGVTPSLLCVNSNFFDLTMLTTSSLLGMFEDPDFETHISLASLQDVGGGRSLLGFYDYPKNNSCFMYVSSAGRATASCFLGIADVTGMTPVAGAQPSWSLLEDKVLANVLLASNNKFKILVMQVVSQKFGTPIMTPWGVLPELVDNSGFAPSTRNPYIEAPAVDDPMVYAFFEDENGGCAMAMFNSSELKIIQPFTLVPIQQQCELFQPRSSCPCNIEAFSPMSPQFSTTSNCTMRSRI